VDSNTHDDEWKRLKEARKSLYNPNRCDNPIGPCACGAWHTPVYQKDALTSFIEKTMWSYYSLLENFLISLGASEGNACEFEILMLPSGTRQIWRNGQHLGSISFETLENKVVITCQK
jgi:hypothetical protein